MEEIKFMQRFIGFQKTTVITLFDLAAKVQDSSERTAAKILNQAFSGPESLQTYNTLLDTAKKCRGEVRTLVDNHYGILADYVDNLSTKPTHG